ncbi:MAG: 1,4-alpha-glucan branching protein domain-containing protein [bacterium]
MNKPAGYLALLLHAHLPFVRHPEYNDSLEENWLYEAITETYIPLLDVFNKLVEDGVDFRVTMSLTPTLMTMLKDELLQERYVRYINRLIELIEKEIIRTKYDNEINTTAIMYREKFYRAKHVFEEKYDRDLVEAFKHLAEIGKLEIITCGATHGFLPLTLHKEAKNAQIKVAVDLHESFLGVRPKGIWLPEAGYEPGDDELLKKHGINFFFVDTHGMLSGTPSPKYGVFAPVYCKSGVAAFARDMESSKQVWSAKEGYPGDFSYREFYRDIGFDLEFDYIKPYIHESGIRINTGVKYYKITGKTELAHKRPYNHLQAREKAAEHAGNFMFNREKQAEHLFALMKREPIIVAPYDAELYGHWWYEGPDFINFLFRKIFYDQKTIKTITPSEYLEKYPKNQVVTPAFSSWGYKGYSEYWLNETNDWIYRHLHKCFEKMMALAYEYRYKPLSALQERALKQAAREVLLAQSSDWAFIMRTQTMVEYAVKRTKTHIHRFDKLNDMIKTDVFDEAYLAEMEWKDNIFPDIDWTSYSL